MFTKIDSKKLLKLLSNHIKYKKRTLKEKISAQIDALGYIDIVGDEYSGLAYVISIDTKYSPKLRLYSLKHGNTLECKIYKKTFNNNKLFASDIVMIIGSKYKQKMKRSENGDFVPIDGVTELWITKYKKVDL